MINEMDNPFSVTKATEFSDFEIKEYWVNLNAKKDVSIESFLNPREYLPKYLIGGKGCGKTHIHRVAMENPITEIIPDNLSVGIREILDRKI